MEAIEDIKEHQPASECNESVNVYLRLGIDTSKSDQQLRQTLTLPAGTGKEVRVAIFTSTEFKHIAEKTKADMIIDLDYISRITAANLEFDKLIATNDVIKVLKPFGRSIGKRIAYCYNKNSFF